MLSGSFGADLTLALAESNLEKRSGLALENAAAAYQRARAAYERGEELQVAAAVDEILKSVELANTSLTATGKDPARAQSAAIRQDDFCDEPTVAIRCRARGELRSLPKPPVNCLALGRSCLVGVFKEALLGILPVNR